MLMASGALASAFGQQDVARGGVKHDTKLLRRLADGDAGKVEATGGHLAGSGWQSTDSLQGDYQRTRHAR